LAQIKALKVEFLAIYFAALAATWRTNPLPMKLIFISLVDRSRGQKNCGYSVPEAGK
jgi:hypothetical protein